MKAKGDMDTAFLDKLFEYSPFKVGRLIDRSFVWYTQELKEFGTNSTELPTK